MQLFPALLFGISASLDALIVGMSYGLRKVRVRLWQNLLISLITLLGTCLSVGLGIWLAPILPPFISQTAGSIVLILLGFYYIVKSMIQCFQKYHNGKNLSASEMQPTLSLPEVFSLGFALSVNNMGIGFSASIAGLSLAPTAVTTFLCSISFLFVGNRLGRCRLLKFAGDTADLLSGLLLIGLGVCELCW